MAAPTILIHSPSSVDQTQFDEIGDNCHKKQPWNISDWHSRSPANTTVGFLESEQKKTQMKSCVTF